MKPYLRLLIVALALSSSLAQAQDPLGMYTAITVKNPNQLEYNISVHSDCDATEESIGKIVEGVMIRSRIKPIQMTYTAGTIHLNVDV